MRHRYGTMLALFTLVAVVVAAVVVAALQTA